jgi:hypothetical protein
MSLLNTAFSEANSEVVGPLPELSDGPAGVCARLQSGPRFPAELQWSAIIFRDIVGSLPLPRICAQSLSTECGSARLLALPVNDTEERHGDDVLFPCGYTMDADGDTINIYYTTEPQTARLR